MLTEQILKQISATNQEPSWLFRERLSALHDFSALPTPSFKYGMGISTSVAGLQLESIKHGINEEQQTIKAPKEVQVLSLHKALQEYPESLKEILKGIFSMEKENKLTAMHKAFFNKLTIIKIPKSSQLQQPIEIHLNQKEDSWFEYLIIIAEENTKAVIFETAISSRSRQQLRSQVVWINAKENAALQYITIQNLSSTAFNLNNRTASLEKSSSIEWIDCFLGSKFTQSNTITHLRGEGSECKTQGVVFGDEEQCFDIDMGAKHAASSSQSDMLTRVVLNDKAKAVYRGLVRINPQARNCTGYQKDETILLSREAQSNAVPNLEIENNEVRCTHGATISSLDEDKLFYMTSRGINEATAKKAIVEGFFQPIIDKIPINEWKEIIIENISKRLGALEQ